MNNNIESTAEKLKRYRNEKKISQEQLAELSEINLSTIKKYECGIRNPKLDQLIKISDALGISLIEFLPYSCNSTTDIIAILTRLIAHNDVDIEVDRDAEGNCINESVRLRFANECVNEFLVEYWYSL